MQETAVNVESHSPRGIHRLAGAILVQAIADMRGGSGRRREEVLRWIEAPSEARFSFVFCCRILNRDPNEVRRFLERREFPAWLFTANLEGAASTPR